ncbi:MAG: hypothetical protein WCV99_00735 [Sterolibacterium sp.]|jgi:hypothetical protein
MGILVYIVAAEEDELTSVGESLEPLEEWSGIARRGLDTAKIVMLHCLLTGEELDLALSHYEPAYVAEESGTVVLRLADEALEKLAGFDEEALERVGEELAASEEFEMERWDEDEVLALVMDLADLARLAEAQGQSLFVWMHPLLT